MQYFSRKMICYSGLGCGERFMGVTGQAAPRLEQSFATLDLFGGVDRIDARRRIDRLIVLGPLQ